MGFHRQLTPDCSLSYRVHLMIVNFVAASESAGLLIVDLTDIRKALVWLENTI